MNNAETLRLNKKAIKIASEKVRNTYSSDKMIMQAVDALLEEEKMINTEYERLRELYWRYYPEALDKIDSVKKLVRIVRQDRKETSKELGIPEETMGYDLNSEELKIMRDYAEVINNHLKATDILEEFIKSSTNNIAPEASKIATPLLTAKLINLAGGFRELALLPASTIQVLGAEKALFRALRSGARGPKHGIILSHQSVQTAKEKGKAARQLANKIAIAVRIDYFRGRKL